MADFGSARSTRPAEDAGFTKDRAKGRTSSLEESPPPRIHPTRCGTITGVLAPRPGLTPPSRTLLHLHQATSHRLPPATTAMFLLKWYLTSQGTASASPPSLSPVAAAGWAGACSGTT